MKLNPRYNIVSMRVTDSELSLIKTITKQQNKSMSDFMRDIIFEGGTLNVSLKKIKKD